MLVLPRDATQSAVNATVRYVVRPSVRPVADIYSADIVCQTVNLRAINRHIYRRYFAVIFPIIYVI